MGWKKRPIRVHELSSDIDQVFFIDESGCSEMKNIKKSIHSSKGVASEDRYFCVTGVLIHKDEFPVISEKIVDLKSKYWPPDGMAQYKKEQKRVCFHSYEIRKSKGVFHPSILHDKNAFLNDLNVFLMELDVKVFSIVIDKQKLYERYRDSYQHPYDLCMEFLLERLSFCVKDDEKCAIVLEGRGKKDDHNLLKHITSLIEKGTYYVPAQKFSFIDGVYFNLKWSEVHENKKSFFGLEIADLFCYPILQYCKNGNRSGPFEVIEPKFHKYPNYVGKGYKKFP